MNAQYSSQSQKGLLTLTNQNNIEWYIYLGVSSFMTTYIDNLYQPATYEEHDKMMVGNGNNISIAHSGKGVLYTPTRKLYTQNLFHVSKASYNLLYIKIDS